MLTRDEAAVYEMLKKRGRSGGFAYINDRTTNSLLKKLARKGFAKLVENKRDDVEDYYVPTEPTEEPKEKTDKKFKMRQFLQVNMRKGKVNQTNEFNDFVNNQFMLDSDEQIVRDENNKVVYQKNEDGEVKLNSENRPIVELETVYFARRKTNARQKGTENVVLRLSDDDENNSEQIFNGVLTTRLGKKQTKVYVFTYNDVDSHTGKSIVEFTHEQITKTKGNSVWVRK